MNLHFYKYHGAGNDFVIIDNAEVTFDETNYALINRICDRHFGIGADGLMVLKKHSGYDFEMLYYNSDGMPGTMCGNGGRCITAFAHLKGYIGNETNFLAMDGIHQAKIINEKSIALRMNDISTIETLSDGFMIDTGSPHFVKFLSGIDALDIYSEGKKIRNEQRFTPDGINVNFCELLSENTLKIATFERGVENETLACGTGSVASAIALCCQKPDNTYKIDIQAKGGNLNVEFTKINNTYTNIWLSGPIAFVFEGKYNVSI